MADAKAANAAGAGFGEAWAWRSNICPPPARLPALSLETWLLGSPVGCSSQCYINVEMNFLDVALLMLPHDLVISSFPCTSGIGAAKLAPAAPACAALACGDRSCLTADSIWPPLLQQSLAYLMRAAY